MIECLTQGLLSSHWNIYHSTTAYFVEPPCIRYCELAADTVISLWCVSCNIAEPAAYWGSFSAKKQCVKNFRLHVKKWWWPSPPLLKVTTVTYKVAPMAVATFPPLSQPKLVLDLATLEGCKAELTWYSWAVWINQWIWSVFDLLYSLPTYVQKTSLLPSNFGGRDNQTFSVTRGFDSL